MSEKVKVIRQQNSDQICKNCKGKTGLDCDSCNGTGIFRDSNYIMITNCIAFQMDTIK